MKLTGLLIAALLISVNLQAAELDAATKKALEQTQALLKDRSALEKLMSGDSGAMQGDAFATQVAGTGAHRDELYAIAAQIFGSIVAKSGGDPAAMSKLLEDAKKDPAKFLASLSPEEQRQIQALAKKIESSTAAGRAGVTKPKP